MLKVIGSICSVGGLIALIYTLINYMNNTESFSFFGESVTISSGDITPVIISAVIMIIGVVILSTSKKTT